MMRSELIGTSVSAGPSAATTTASAISASTTPFNVDRQPRETPTARTIVNASTISTEEARNDARTRKTLLMVGPFSFHPLRGKLVRRHAHSDDRGFGSQARPD